VNISIQKLTLVCLKAASQRICGIGIVSNHFLQIYCWVWRWKNSENQSMSDALRTVM